MRYFLLALFFSLSVFAVNPSLEWVGSYDIAMKKAAGEKKIALIMLSSPTCDVCNYMKGVAFKDPELVNELNRRFVITEVDITQKKVPTGLRALGTPTFYFLNPDTGKVMKRFVGGLKAADFYEEAVKIRR